MLAYKILGSILVHVILARRARNAFSDSMAALCWSFSVQLLTAVRRSSLQGTADKDAIKILSVKESSELLKPRS